MSELSTTPRHVHYGGRRSVTRTRFERIGLATLPAACGLLFGMLMTLVIADAFGTTVQALVFH